MDPRIRIRIRIRTKISWIRNIDMQCGFDFGIWNFLIFPEADLSASFY
jgi:hypothetical protein